MLRLIATAALALTMSAGASNAQTSTWSFRSAVDPITDARRGAASIESREEITRSISGEEALNSGRLHGNSRYMLMVKCDYATREVYVSLATPRGMTRSKTTVIQRFDSAEPTTPHWVTTSSAVGLFHPDEVAAFVAQARRANRIALRIAGVDGAAPVDTVTFSGVGAARAIASVYQACGQQLPAI